MRKFLEGKRNIVNYGRDRMGSMRGRQEKGRVVREREGREWIEGWQIKKWRKWEYREGKGWSSLPLHIHKKNCCRRHLCFLKCNRLGIIMHCNINIKNYVFLVIKFGEGNQKQLRGGGNLNYIHPCKNLFWGIKKHTFLWKQIKGDINAHFEIPTLFWKTKF